MGRRRSPGQSDTVCAWGSATRTLPLMPTTEGSGFRQGERVRMLNSRKGRYLWLCTGRNHGAGRLGVLRHHVTCRVSGRPHYCGLTGSMRECAGRDGRCRKMSRAALWGWRPRPCPLCPVRRLSRQPRPEDAAEPESSGPIRFSTSKASPRLWPVERSLGSNFRRPWAKVLPVSLLGMGLVLWCFFREETEVDEQLGTLFREHVPGLLAETPKSKMLPPSEHKNS